MIGDAVINDGPGLLLIVEKFPWANTVEVTRGAEAAMEEMMPGLPGIDVDTTIFRPATFVEVALENLINSLILSAILVLVVLVLFLWDWRIALISATIIPLTMVITLLVLSLLGTTLNVLGNAAIDERWVSIFPMSDPPRVLVRIRKIVEGFEREQIEINSDEVTLVRVGHHPEQNPPALYVVLDLTGDDVAVGATEVDADLLKVTVTR